MIKNQTNVPKSIYLSHAVLVLLLILIFVILLVFLYSNVSYQARLKVLSTYYTKGLETQKLLNDRSTPSAATLFHDSIEKSKHEDSSLLYGYITDQQGKILIHSQTQEVGKFVLDRTAKTIFDNSKFSVISSRVGEKGSIIPGYSVKIPIALPDSSSGSLCLVLSKKIIDRRISVEILPFMSKTFFLSTIALVSVLFFLLTVFVVILRKTRTQKAFYDHQKNIYLASIAGSLAHEIKNPLNSININVQLLEEKTTQLPNQERTRSLIGRIKREIKDLEKYLSDFLSYAKPTPLEKKPMVFQETILQTLQTIEPECKEKNITVSTDLPDTKIIIYGDNHYIYRSLLNILLNAIQALQKNGVITVQLKQEKHNCYLHITDDGPGIPPEIQDNIFDLFVSLKTEGTGLGLAICKKIIEEHNGEISFTSDEDKGTTFIIKLPLYTHRPKIEM